MESLIAALRDPACYPHPVERVEVVETHISWVLLAGDYAYKLKRPVLLPFLDFRALPDRRRFCEEELRLNRRTAPEIYLEVVPVALTLRGPAIGAPGEPIEYAVKMRRFPGDALAESMAGRGAVRAPQIDAMAAALAHLHASAPGATREDDYGTPAQVAAPALGNFEQIAALGGELRAAVLLDRLRTWTARECGRLAADFAARREEGRVRECHGDLHLGNIAFLGERALPFDGIEFDPALRWIDVMSEVAFLVMDLQAHGLAGPGWRLLNAYLEATGDYDGARVLRFYLVYRAMVRAKVACIRGAAAQFGRYLDRADALARDGRPALVLMHGLSGSGKTTLSQALLERIGALRLRSDVERKRLHGLPPAARTEAAPGAGIYAAASSRRVYAHLADMAERVLAAGYPAIVDAAFLQREQRSAFRRMAARRGAECVIAHCAAPEATLLARVAARAAQGSDASEAGAEILAHQWGVSEPLGADEREMSVDIDASTAAAVRHGVDAVAAWLSVGSGTHAFH